MTAPLVVFSPIVNKYSPTPSLILFTYRHTEKLLPLMLSTSFVTMELLPSFPSKLPPPEDRVLQLIDNDNQTKGEPNEESGGK